MIGRFRKRLVLFDLNSMQMSKPKSKRYLGLERIATLSREATHVCFMGLWLKKALPLCSYSGVGM